MHIKAYLYNIIKVMIITAGFFGLLFQAGPYHRAFAENQPLVQAEKIEPAYVEKAEKNYLVSLRAHVTNNGESDTVNIEVIGTDDNDDIVKHVRFSGQIPRGSTRVLMEQFQIRGDDYQRIANWAVKQ